MVEVMMDAFKKLIVTTVARGQHEILQPERPSSQIEGQKISWKMLDSDGFIARLKE